jgi:WhiB family transcriptional regulator, redox-sensing transcriptional regulator
MHPRLPHRTVKHLSETWEEVPGTAAPRASLNPSSMDDHTPLPDHHTPPWMQAALCREASAGEFFPSDGVGVERARRVCAGCPVKAECLEYALTYRIDHGVWGGCSERERRRILRQRRLTAAARS